jgi:hypothetical protein
MPEIPGGNLLANNPVTGTSDSAAGVTGQSNTGPGVSGQSLGRSGAGPDGSSILPSPPSDGVLGQGLNGVHGIANTKTTTTSGAGVWGENASGDGVVGTGYHGVHGMTTANGGAGVWGDDTSSDSTGAGVSGTSKNGSGVSGSSTSYDGVHGVSQSSEHAGVSGSNTAGGYGVWASGKTAGYFAGDVTITGDITAVNAVSANTVSAQDVVLNGADCAEEFDVRATAGIEPGSVVVFGPGGTLGVSDQPYDKKVAGVISGAGSYRPGMILDRRASNVPRAPVALFGKVYCKVDAAYGSIEVGDLLTSSPTAGCAMKAADSARAFGSVIGKALAPQCEGRGLIPIFVALQ